MIFFPRKIGHCPLSGFLAGQKWMLLANMEKYGKTDGKWISHDAGGFCEDHPLMVWMYVYVSWGVVTCLTKKHRGFWGMTSPIVRIQWIETCQQNWVDLIYLHRIKDKPQYLDVHPKWCINHMLGIFHRCIRDLGIWVVFLVTNLMGRTALVTKLCLQTTFSILLKMSLGMGYLYVFMVFGYSWKHMFFQLVSKPM